MQPRTILADDGVGLHVEVSGAGPDVVALSGGPGCVHYFADARLAPEGFRCWFPDPRGVGRSGGGPHDMTRAVADLEAIRREAGIDRWLLLGHSWGADLAVRYAVDHPERVRGVVAIAGHGCHRDRSWSAAYEAGKAREEPLPIDYDADVHASLSASFNDWIHEPTLWRSLADCRVPMRILAAGRDIRPDWPLRQLGELVPRATFQVVPDVVHDFWHTAPDVWRRVCTRACQELNQELSAG